MSTSTRAYSYVFTINNPTDDDIELCKNIDCKYIVFGREIAPTTGTPHLQGYISFKHQKSFNVVRSKIFNLKAHIETAKGNAIQNRKYCTKDDDYFEKGDIPKQGKRTDIDNIKENIKSGKNIKYLLDNNYIVNNQQLKYSENLNKYYEKPRNWKPTVKWFYGRTGTGKTKQAYEELSGDDNIDDLYVTLDNGKWWDGYDGQSNVIIDDMRSDFMKYHQLLKLLDRYQYKVEIKGGTRQFVAKNIIITSPFHPKDMYQTHEDKEQLLRRIDIIKEFV